MIPILLFLAGSFSAAAQYVELIPPAAIGEDLTATWTVAIANGTPGWPLTVTFHGPTAGTPVSMPPGCAVQDSPGHVRCDLSTLPPGERWELAFTLRYDTLYAFLSATAGYFGYLVSASAVLVREFPVTTTADGGPGSLRQAILDMNQVCTNPDEPCGPAFRIDGPVPAEGWFTIRPSSPLPPIAAAAGIFDGRTQTAHTGDTNPAGPEIMLDGSSTSSGHGLQFLGTDGRFTDLAVGNFAGNGIASAPAVQTRIERCHLGMDPSGVRRAPNGTRGVQIEGGQIWVFDSLLAGNFRSGGWFDTNGIARIAGNRFTGNGASGFYARLTSRLHRVSAVQDNVISDNAHAGISLDRASVGDYANNSFGGNLGRAIDIGIDGPNVNTVPGLPGQGGVVGMPVVTSARYENGETRIEIRIAPRSLAGNPFDERVYVYASPVPKDGGALLGIATRDETGGGHTYALHVPRDLRGQWVSAATYVEYLYNWDDIAPGTSEVSEPRRVD